MSSTMDQKTYHRNNKVGGDSRRKSGDVAKAVRELISSGKSDVGVMSELRAKYGDDSAMIDAVFDGYKDRLEYIQKKAKKFKKLMHDRYNKYNLSYPQLVRKATKYQKRYELSDDEFELFLKYVLTEKPYGSYGHDLSNTAMSKTLGYNISDPSAKLRVGDDELDVMQEILRVHGETRALHNNVSIQSLTYGGVQAQGPGMGIVLNPEVVCTYNQAKHNKYSFVHPIIAALYLNRSQYIDEHTLIANMSHIVKCKYEGKPIATKPEFNLLWNMMVDPNDTVCDMSNPLKDLKNRILLQTRLWDSVMNLRSGKHYNDRLVEFLVAIDNCRNNIYDTPDLTYIKDEGAILRRLMSAFSLRPTIVSTMPIYGAAISGISMNGAVNVGKVTTVPMISVTLPYSNRYIGGAGVAPGAPAVNLDTALSNAQWFVEDKMLVPKQQTVIHSADVLIFYVNRRYQQVQLASANNPFNFNTLPMTVSGFQKLNDYKVNATTPLSIGDNQFNLTSLVCVNTSPMNNSNDEMITGCSTLIVGTDGSVSQYDPQNASDGLPTIQNILESDALKAKEQKGTIYIYTKVPKA